VQLLFRLTEQAACVTFPSESAVDVMFCLAVDEVKVPASSQLGKVIFQYGVAVPFRIHSNVTPWTVSLLK